MVPEPEGSSPYLQEPATSCYPEPTGSTPHPPANLSKIHSGPIIPSMPLSSEWSLYFGLSHQNPVHFTLIFHACHVHCPPHSP
jgi:hypothetical protein